MNLITLKKIVYHFILFCVFPLLCARSVYATAYYAKASGNWNVAATWSLSPCGGAQPNAPSAPTATDDVVICSGFTVSITANAIINNINVSNGGTLSIGGKNLTVNGTTTIYGILTETSTNGTDVFVGRVTIETGGVWNFTVNETPEFRGGFVNNGGTFTSSSSDYTFTTNNQVVGGTSALTFNGSITVTGAITLTNTNTHTDGITVAGTLNGSVAGSVFNNQGILKIQGAAAPMVTGTLTATFNPNTVVYIGTLAQAIKATTYYNLTVSSSNTATLGGATAVNGDLTISSGTLADGGNQITGVGGKTFTIASGASYTTTRIATPWFPTNMTLSLDNNSTVNYSGITGFTLPVTPATYGNLNIAGAVTKTLGSALAVNGTLTLTSGILAIAGNNLTLGTSASIAGAFSTTNMITSTGGNIIKQFTSVPLAFTVFPLGTTGAYTPATINFTAATFGGIGSISIQAIAAKAPNQFDNTNSLVKYWAISTSNISNIDATLNFTYVQAEADATYEPAGSYVGGYYPGSAPWQIGTDDYTLNVISFTKTAVANLTGNWTAAREYGLNGVQTYYSRGTGNWETIATWSTISHAGAAATQTPPAGSNVDIGNSNTVTKTSSTALSVNSIQIDATGILNMGAQTGLTISTFTGDGTIQLASGTFPSVTTNNFITTTGSTIEYNSSSSFTLPTSPASYMNLTVSTGGTKTLGSGITVNENLNILTTAVLADGGYTLNVKGNITNNSTHSGSGKIYLNGTSAQTISGASANYGNIELSNAAGAAFSGTLINTVTGNLTATSGILSIGAFSTSLTVSGTTTIISTMNITSATGTHAFTELINNGTFNNNTVNEAVTINGNMQNNGTFNSGSGLYTLNGLTKILSGTLSFVTLTAANTYANNGTLVVTGTFTINTGLTFTNNATATISTLTVTGSTFLNYNTVSITTALGGTGTFTNQGVSAVLFLAVTPGITTLNANSLGNTVNYNGSAAVDIYVPASSTYHHLTISGSNTKTLTAPITVNGDLRITGGTLSTSTFQITGNATGTFAMSAGTGFIVGLQTSTVNVDFPTLFQNFNINTSSTVSYVARFAQAISCSPSYGNLTLTTGNTAITKTLAASTLNITGDLTILNGARVVTLSVANNTVNISGNLLGDGLLTLTTGTVAIGGNNSAYTGTETIGSSLFKFNGTGAQTIKALTYNNLEIDKTSGVASFANNAAVGNNLTITKGTLQLDGYTFSVTGATSISGTLTIASATGTKLFNDVAITGTGNWNAATAVPFSINGNLQNDGVFTSNSGIYTFTGTSKAMSGSHSLTFDNVAINTGAVYTTTTNTIITTALSGVGSLTVGTNNSLTLGGTCTVTTFIPSTNNATVYFNSTLAGQAIPANTYYNLIIDKSTQTATVGGNITVNNNLTVTSGGLTVGTNNVSVAGITQIDGTLTASSTNMSFAGNFINNGTFTHNNGTITFSGTTAISGTSVSDFNNLTISGAATAPSGNMNIAGNLVNNGTFTHNSGTTTFNGTSTISGSSAINLNNVTISGILIGVSAGNYNVAGNWINNGTYTHNTGTVTFNGTTTLSGSAITSLNNVTITGTLTGVSAGNFNIAGNFINNGTFTHNSGTTTFNGTTTLSGSSAISLNNVTISGTLSGVSAGNFDIAGDFVNNGIFTHNSGSVTFNGTTTLSGSSVSTFNNIIISGSLIGVNSGNFNLVGNFTNNGAFTHNSGTVTFAGTSVLTGTTTLTTFNNLTVNNLSSLNIAVQKQATTAGTLTNDGTLSLKGDASGTASLIDNGIAGAGTYNDEQYITGTRWWYISSPMANEFSDVYNASNTIDNGIFTYNEPTATYVRITDNVTALNAARGYATKFKNVANRTNTYQGTINTGAASLNLTGNGTGQSWNLAGNPYPSAIDWEAASGWTKTNVRSDIWFRSNGTYAIYSATSHLGTNGATRYIPAMQAFWVKCTAATGTLGMNNSTRVHDPQALLRMGDPPNTFRVTAEINGNKDETVIAFNEIANDNYDIYDSEKMFGGDNNFPQLYVTLVGNKKTAIDVMNSFSIDKDIPLGFKAGIAGNYTLSFAGLNTFDSNANFYLEDKLSKAIVDIKANPIYTFASAVVDNNTRFIIHFKAPGGLPVSLISFDAEYNSEKVDIVWATLSEANNKSFVVERSSDGNKFEQIYETTGAGNSNELIRYTTADFSPLTGISYYRLKQTDFDGNFSYTQIIQVHKPLNKDEFIKNLIVTENIISFDIEESNTDKYEIQIIDNGGNTVINETLDNNSHSAIINISQLAKTTYILRVMSNSTAFIDRFIKQ